MFRIIVGILAVMIGAAAYGYFAWAAHRIDFDAFVDPQWPRAFPYPDKWLLALIKYYDARHPAAQGSIIMCSEFPRVMRDVTWASRVGAFVFAAGMALLLPNLLRCLPSRNRGFDVIGSGDSAARPPADERGN